MKKILFSDKFGLTEAVLSGRKTQTRRIITYPKSSKGQDVSGFYVYRRMSDNAVLEYPIMHDADDFDIEGAYILPKYKVGEVVAVAQSYKDCGYGECAPIASLDENGIATFGSDAGSYNKMFVKADIMPHRIRIINVRIERLQDISDEDCIAEGVVKGRVGSENTHFMNAYYPPTMMQLPCCTPREAYAILIDRILGKGTWDKNPFVFVYGFELVD